MVFLAGGEFSKRVSGWHVLGLQCLVVSVQLVYFLW